MKASTSYISKQRQIQNINPNWFLVIGIFTLTFSQITYKIDLLAWISMVPFLIYLSITKGWKSRILFSMALITSWSFIVFKIITPPIPYVLIFLYSIPIGIFHLPGYLIASSHANRRFSVLIFPMIMTISEWIQYSFTPFASWGVAAYTQSESLVIMQFVSIFGIAGLSFLIYWVNSSIANLIIYNKRSFLNLTSPILIVSFAVIFGAMRINHYYTTGVDTIKVAAVGTYSEIGGLPLPDDDKNEHDIKSLIERTRIAAKAGARFVVWNEASFLLKPNNEDLWIESFKKLAKDEEISIIASYVLITSSSPLHYDNKFQFISPKGDIIFTYLKHQPVPGEPAKKGKEEMRTFSTEGINFGGAICYDYDFPYLARENSDADIVGLPSSDWRGIDPIHTQMACYRAIEQGHSILRSTRFGLSAAITPIGDMTTKMSSFDTNNRVMIAQLPKKSIKTVYSKIGDLFIYICFAVTPAFLLIKKNEVSL